MIDQLPNEPPSSYKVLDLKDIENNSHNNDKQNDSSSTQANLIELLRDASIKDKSYFCIGVITAIMSGANQPANLILFGNILNSFNTADRQEQQRMISFLAIMYVVVAVQMFITQFLQTATMTSFAANQTKYLREIYFKALIRQPIAFFDAEDQGALASSVMESTLVIQDGIGEKFALAVQFTCSFVFGLIVALYYCWKLALLICGIVPVFIILIGSLAGILTKSTQEASDAYNNAGSIAQEALGAIRTVYGFNGEDRTIQSYMKKLVYY